MRKEIIINATSNEIRIAITEDKRLSELYVETPEKERMVGDIYLGKVAKVMPGIRAAFIDLGLKQDAFLHFSDIGNTLGEYSSLIGDDDADVDTDDDSVEAHFARDFTTLYDELAAKESPALARVREWVRRRFKLSEDAAILVSEVECKLPGCPPLETVVAFWTKDPVEGDKRYHFKLFKKVSEVVYDDLPFAWLLDTLVVPEGFACECC